jgi:hypothetical protein
MADDAFAPGTPEGELEQRGGIAVSVRGERGKMGTVVLTNDRLLFTQQKFATAGGGVLAAVAADQLQKRYERKSGGPREVLALAGLRGAGLKRRRLLPDLYEFTLDDGSTCWVSRDLRETWDPTIRRLLAERHQRRVVDDGEDGWRVE